MWGKRRVEKLRQEHELSPEIVPDDIHEARAMRAETHQDMRQVRAQASFVARLAGGLQERGPKNHYVELLNFYARENG